MSPEPAFLREAASSGLRAGPGSLSAWLTPSVWVPESTPCPPTGVGAGRTLSPRCPHAAHRTDSHLLTDSAGGRPPGPPRSESAPETRGHRGIQFHFPARGLAGPVPCWGLGRLGGGRWGRKPRPRGGVGGQRGPQGPLTPRETPCGQSPPCRSRGLRTPRQWGGGRSPSRRPGP